MATVTDNLEDAATRHTVYLLRWSQGTYTRHSKLVDEMVADLIRKLNLRAPTDGSFTASRLKAMIAATKDQSKELYGAIQKAVDGDFKELSAYEARFQLQAVQSAYPIELALNTVTPAQIHSAAMARPFQGKVLNEWWRDQEYSVRKRFQSQIRLGYVEGESLSQISTRLRQAGDLTKRQMEAVIRTATNHYAQTARNQVTAANKDLFKYEIWSATLDGRTTAICRSRDGKRYEVGKGPNPPAHWNCRSSRVPVTKSWKELGFTGMGDDEPLSNRPFVADTRKVKDIPKSMRDQVIGKTTDKSYNDWLKTQPRGFVEEVLGVKKSKLYLDGNLSLDKFVNRRGRELTLDQLAASESKAMKSAFIKAFG